MSLYVYCVTVTKCICSFNVLLKCAPVLGLRCRCWAGRARAGDGDIRRRIHLLGDLLSDRLGNDLKKNRDGDIFDFDKIAALRDSIRPSLHCWVVSTDLLDLPLVAGGDQQRLDPVWQGQFHGVRRRCCLGDYEELIFVFVQLRQITGKCDCFLNHHTSYSKYLLKSTDCLVSCDSYQDILTILSRYQGSPQIR